MDDYTKKEILKYSAIALLIILIAAGIVWWNFSATRIKVPYRDYIVAREDMSFEKPAVESIAKNLNVPWSLDFLPDGSIIFTEREGNVRLIDIREGLLPKPIFRVGETATIGEGGLLGIAIDPNFKKNNHIFLYYTYKDDVKIGNKIIRLRYQDKQLFDPELIIDNIPGERNHNGGRIKFGPDNFLYITTGDATLEAIAQDVNSLGGKILRINTSRSFIKENPFPGSPIYSYGHRNPQGLAWDNQGKLWSTEHGPSAKDELNMIEKGKNYGWPIIKGDEDKPGLNIPILQSGRDTWAPSGIDYIGGSLFFTGLRGQALYEVEIDDNTLLMKEHFKKEFGRIRDVVAGPDNFLYLITNNRDGRGLPKDYDDQMLRVDPSQL